MGDSHYLADRAERAAKHYAAIHMARHLRWDHGLSRRKVAKRLGVKESWVRDYIDSEQEER